MTAASTSNGDGSFDSDRTRWLDQGGLIKSRSVVTTLLNRQLGLNNFSKCGDSSITAVTRQLLISRAVSDESGRSVKAVKVELKAGNNGQTADTQNPWTQIRNSENTYVTKIGITENRVWTRKTFGRGRGYANNMAKEEFYSVESTYGSGFKCLKSLHSSASGKLKKAFVVAGRVLSSEKLTTYFLTLVEPGILRAYDMVKNQVTDELRLPLNISQGITGFTDMDVVDSTRRIFIMGTGKKLTKVVLLLNYPPWKEVGLIHVQIPFQLEMTEGLCFLLQGKFLQITSWALLMQKVTNIKEQHDSDPSVANTSRTALPPIKFEGKLTELPIILSKIHLSSEYIGLINNTTVPMFFGILKSGLNFFNFYKSPMSICEFKYDSPEDLIDVFQFPDGSSRALICAHFTGQSQFVEFKCQWDAGKEEKIVNLSNLNVCNYWKNPRSVVTPMPTPTREGGRPKRACVGNNNASYFNINKPTILGLEYCAVMNMIAVLTADEEELQVAIYEPVTLKMVKALPPIYVWSRVSGSDDVNKRRESICGIDFTFEMDFIFISFLYSCDCKPQRETFLMRLLAEKCLP